MKPVRPSILIESITRLSPVPKDDKLDKLTVDKQPVLKDINRDWLPHIEKKHGFCGLHFGAFPGRLLH